MIKIKIYELEKHRNETTFRPLLMEHEYFNQIGIEFVTNGHADFAFVGHASFINKKISLSESIDFGLKFLNTVKEPYFLFDGQDRATLIGSYEVFLQSKAIYLFKPTLYKNRENYLNKYVNGRLYWGNGDYSLPNLNCIYNIKLNHTNWLSTMNPQWYEYTDNKEYDVSAMFSPSQKDTFEHGINQSIYYTQHRNNLFNNLNKKYKITKIENNKKFEMNEYYNRMFNSKITLAPFGFGEMAPRDLESAMFGSVLIKPDMSHIETLPNIYIPYETYIPCKHDFSDLNEKIDYVLSDYKNIQKKLVENFRKRYIEEYNPEKLVMYYYNIFKNLNGIITE